jgi:hypothetical protein
MMLGVGPAQRRISLSLKAALPKEPEAAAEEEAEEAPSRRRGRGRRRCAGTWGHDVSAGRPAGGSRSRAAERPKIADRFES